MSSRDDIRRIQQYDQVLREISDRIDLQIRVAEQHRTRLGDA